MTFDQVTPSAPTFPGQELDVRTELLLGNTWTNISAYVVQDSVKITRGHPDESTTTAPASLTMKVFNGDGRFSSMNPNGPYFGQIGNNVKIRASVPEGVTYLRSEYDTVSYAQCPNTAALQFTGNLDVQIDAAMDNWYGAQLAGQWNDTTGQRGWMLFVTAEGYLTFYFNNSYSESSSVPLPVIPSPQRMCVRVTYASSTGTLTFYTSPAGLSSPTWTQLGTSFTFGSGYPLVSNTAPLQIGYLPNAGISTFYSGGLVDAGYATEYTNLATWSWGFNGKIYAAQVLVNSTVVANPDFTAQTAGVTSFTDGSGNTWSVNGTAAIDNRKYRFHGEVAEFPQSWGPVGNNVKVKITAGGLLRRIGMGQTPTNSALVRAFTKLTGTSAPVAYWPGEDGQFATQIASALPNGTPMMISGSPQLASNSDYPSSDSLPVLNGAWFTGDVPSYSSTATTFTCLFDPSTSEAAEGSSYTIATLYMGGSSSYGLIMLEYYNPTVPLGNQQIYVYAYPPGSTTPLVTVNTTAAVLAGDPMLICVAITSTGIALNIWTQQNGWLSSISGSYSGTAGQVARVVVNGGLAIVGNTAYRFVDSSAGHFAVIPSGINPYILTGPVQAWAGEYAGMRFMRLCLEEGIPFIGRGNLTDTVQMGVQGIETVSSLLQECVDTDQSLWTEPRGCPGFGFRTRVSIGNQSAVVQFDYTKDQLSGALAPTEDDQTTLNDVTVTQEYDGSSSRQVLTSGPLSTGTPPNGVGAYSTEVTVNLQYDSQLPSVCSWILYKSTVKQPRYPGISCDLANSALSPAMYYAIQDMDLGDRLQIINPPPWLPPGMVDQIVQQTKENLFIKQFAESWVGIPALPWNVSYYDDINYGRYDTAGSTLTSALGANLSTAQSLFSVQDVTGGLTGSLNGWTAYLGTMALDNSVTYPGGQFPWSVVWTSNGTSGGALEGSVTPFSVTVSDSYCASAWVYFPAGGTVKIGFDWLNSSGGYISTSTASVTVPANTWTPIGSGALVAPSGAVTAYQRVAPGTVASGTVLAVQGFYAWQGAVQATTSSGPVWVTSSTHWPFSINVSPIGGLASEEIVVTAVSGSTSPQTFTVVRGANGVCPAHAAGNDIRLYIPPVYSL